MATENPLVTVAAFLTHAEASMARSFLEADGLRVVVADDNVARLGFHLSAIAGGIKLQVHRSEEERARELLTELESPSGPRLVEDEPAPSRSRERE